MSARRYFQVATVACLLIGVASLVVAIVSLWRPTDENRVDLFLRAYAWLYVGVLHALLAEPRYRPASGDSDG